MSDELDLRTIDRIHIPEPAFTARVRAAIEREVDISFVDTTPSIAGDTEGDDARRDKVWRLALVAAVVIAIMLGIVVAATRNDSRQPDELPIATTPPTPAANGSIAFVADGNDNGIDADPADDVIYTVRPDAGHLRVMTPPGSLPVTRVTAPRWSPDGTRLAYIRDLSELVVVEVATGKVTTRVPLPDDEQDDEQSMRAWSVLVWSPDRRSILVRGSTLQVVSLATGQWHTAIDAPTNVPSFSPDGRWLLLANGDSIALVPADAVLDSGETDLLGLLETRLLPIAGGQVFVASWSPDGTEVVVGVSDESAGRWSGPIEIVDVADGSVRPLGVTGISPAWSPVGDRIAYLRELDDGGAELRIVGVDGSGDHAVGDTFIPPVWSPDGTRLLALDSVGLVSRSATTGAAIRLTPPELAPNGVQLDWLPGLETWSGGTGLGGDMAPTWQSITAP